MAVMRGLRQRPAVASLPRGAACGERLMHFSPVSGLPDSATPGREQLRSAQLGWKSTCTACRGEAASSSGSLAVHQGRTMLRAPPPLNILPRRAPSMGPPSAALGGKGGASHGWAAPQGTEQTLVDHLAVVATGTAKAQFSSKRQASQARWIFPADGWLRPASARWVRTSPGQKEALVAPQAGYHGRTGMTGERSSGSRGIRHRAGAARLHQAQVWWARHADKAPGAAHFRTVITLGGMSRNPALTVVHRSVRAVAATGPGPWRIARSVVTVYRYPAAEAGGKPCAAARGCDMAQEEDLASLRLPAAADVEYHAPLLIVANLGHRHPTQRHLARIPSSSSGSVSRGACAPTNDGRSSMAFSLTRLFPAHPLGLTTPDFRVLW